MIEAAHSIDVDVEYKHTVLFRLCDGGAIRVTVSRNSVLLECRNSANEPNTIPNMFDAVHLKPTQFKATLTKMEVY